MVTVISLPWVALLLLPLGGVYYYIQNFYRWVENALNYTRHVNFRSMDRRPA